MRSWGVKVLSQNVCATVPGRVGTARHAPGHSGERCPPDKRRTGLELTPSGGPGGRNYSH